jgi:hypothetical protein
MRKREFEKLLKQAIIEEAEEQGAIFEASPETEPIPETAQARFDAALNGKRRPNRSVFTRLRYFAYRNGRRLAFGAIAVGSVAALVLVVGLLTRTVLNGKKGGSAPEKGESAPENGDYASTSAPVRTSEPGPLETNEPEGTTEPSSVDALVGTWMLEAMESEDESQSGQITVMNAMIAAGKYEATYTFLSDGNGLAYWDIEGEKTAQAFTYVVDGDKLTFSGETMTFEIDGDRMKLRESDLTMLFKRREKGAAEETTDPSGKVYYTISDFDDIIIGESTVDDVFSITSNIPLYASSYGALIELPKEGGGYIHIKCYGPEGIVGSIEEVSKSVDPRKESQGDGSLDNTEQTETWSDNGIDGIGVWETDIYDYPSLYLELFDDGTARILDLFGDYDIRAHYAWDYDRDSIRITFSDQTVVKTAELHINTDTMTLTLADGSTAEAERTEGVVLPLRAADTGRSRNPISLPAVCPAYALGTSKKETVEGILFRYDLDGDGTEETISFRQSPDDGDTPVIVSIDEQEYPIAELDPRDKVEQAILFQPDPASEDLALVLTTMDVIADWNETAILLLHGKEVRKIKAESNDAYAYLQDGTLHMTARCWLMGTYYGSRAYVGAELEPESEWYETGVLDRVKDWTREEQIEFNRLFEVVRDLPCTIDGKPAVIEPGTWVYLLRWKDTDDFAEIMTEDGSVARLAFTEEHGQRFEDGNDDVSWYCIDGVDAEDYFDNLCMAG